MEESCAALIIVSQKKKHCHVEQEIVSQKKKHCHVEQEIVSQKKKHCHVEQEIDRINSLPLHILHHIFSFLPLRYAVPTSAVCRRWRYLFLTATDDLHLRQDTSSVEPAAFINYVHNALHLRHISGKFTTPKFRLSLSSISCFPPLLNRIYPWISSSSSSIQELDLTLCNHDPHSDVTERMNRLPKQPIFEFPDRLSSLASLRILKLVNVRISYLPLFPSLESLHLNRVCIQYPFVSPPCLLNNTVEVRGPDRRFGDLYIVCPPRFRRLKLSCNLWAARFASCKISGPMLQEVNISRDLRLTSIEITEANKLERLRIKRWAAAYFRLSSAPCLRSFTWLHSHPRQWQFGNFISLSKAGLLFYRETPVTLQLYIGILHAVSWTRVLELDHYVIKQVFGNVQDLHNNLPALSNLRFLKLKVDMGCNCYNHILCLLNFCPNLETLVITTQSVRTRIFSDEKEEYLQEGSLYCLSHHLKVIEFQDFPAQRNDLQFVAYFLQNATVLKKMEARTCRILRTIKGQLEVASKIFGFPRASTNALISVL